MGNVKNLISSLSELYKKLFQEESVELSADFYLDVLAEQAEANKKKLVDLGFWTKDGEYKEDYQEIDEYDALWRNV